MKEYYEKDRILNAYCLFITKSLFSSDPATERITGTIGKVASDWGSEAMYFFVDNEAGERRQLRLDLLHPLYKEILSMGISAYHSNSNVLIGIDDNNKIIYFYLE
ncbi:MAG: hypothetical protein JEY91_18430 [Spirochaetaceae bacterium]|nr:hypothetical protein [Spirochaetaceae bacterium]